MIRYYTYISDAKVDMLLPQVPGALQRKVAAKFGFDLKIISASISSETNTLDNRISRLQIVEEFVRSNETVGEPNQLTPWIQGATEAVLMATARGAIFLASSRRTVLVLGGSARHLIGSVATSEEGVPRSLVHAIVDDLEMLARGEQRGSQLQHLLDPAPSLELNQRSAPLWTTYLDYALDYEGPSQRMSFLAKRLASYERSDGKTYVLGSPLFVVTD